MSWEMKARIWDTESGQELSKLPEKGSVRSAKFSPDGSKVVTISYDGTARIWDAKSGLELSKLPHEGPVDSARFSSDAAKVVTTSRDMTARIWDAKSGLELAKLPHEGRVDYAEFSPDGTKVVTISHEDMARIWIVSSQDLVKIACSRITENLTIQQWEYYLDESECRTCPRVGRFRQSQQECLPCIGDFHRSAG